MTIKLYNSNNFIINCDDFGMNNSINEACIKLNNQQKLNSISVIMNYQDENQILEYLKNFKGKVGLHLNFTESNPLNKNFKDELLNSGCFQGYKKLILSYLSRRLNYEILFKEAEQQFLNLQKINGYVSHIDSHQHIHMLPIIWKLTHELADKYNVERIRNPVEKINKVDSLGIILKKIIFKFLNFINKKKQNIKYLNFFGHTLQNTKNYKELFFSKLQGTQNNIEIMIHVSSNDKDTLNNEKIKFGRNREYENINNIDFRFED